MRPVIVVVSEAGAVIEAVFGPLICDHIPVPLAATLAAIVAVETLHKACAAPALAVVGGSFTTMLTWSVDDAQEPLLMVHSNTYVPAVVKPVIVVDSEDGVVIVAVAGPLIWVHAPVPTEGVLAAIVAVPEAEQTDCAEPAAEVVGTSLTTTLTWSLDAVHGPLEIVHSNTYVPAIKPVIVVVGKDAVVMLAVFGPLICVHAPVPTDGVLPAIVALAAQIACALPAAAVVGNS
jgi:uncharacterized protein YejL (UPF0352 family)